tara:strand:- start:218 stop:772 length:555 start_codon:yes stop_codon:yes gene_type:complete
MKKIILCTVVLILSGTKVSAQENVVKTNILSPLFYSGSVSFEHVFNWSSSYNIGISYTPSQDISASYFDEKQKLTGFAATLGLRLYTKKDAPSGYYLGPYLRHQSVSLETDDISATLSVSSAGIITGYQFIINEVFSIDIYMGGGIGMYNIDESSSFDEVTDFLGGGKVVGSAVTIGFTLGYAF